MKSVYSFHPQLILRTPARPFTLDITAASVQAALTDDGFMEAIYLASPALHAECGKWQRNELTDARKIERLRGTLTRYYARFMSRSTPFGLFAGCSVLAWGDKSCLELRPCQHGRYTRLDMHYLCALAQHLAARPDVQSGLRFWPNTSLYHLGPAIRYIERQYDLDGRCTHQISAVEASEAVVQVLALAEQGRTLPQLAAALLAENDAAETAEVANFLADLVAAQLLVSELEPTVTGDEFFVHLLAVVRRLAAQVSDPALPALLATLTAVQQALAQLDAPGANSAAAYQRIEALLAPLGVPVEAGKLFQTDAQHGLAAGPSQKAGSTASTSPASLDAALQGPLLEALTVLSYLSASPENTRLTDFARRFEERYEGQAVPLLVALDTESGVPYASYGRNRYSTLVHDLVLPGAGRVLRPASLSAAQQWLLQQLRAAERTRCYSLDLTAAGLRAAGLAPGVLPLPPSMGVLFRLIDGHRMLLESAGGSSAANLLGRFVHAVPGIGPLIEELTAHEQAQNPGVAFAEISHLPASRIGNLLQRPHFRSFEIPYLAQSTRPASQQLRVQGLALAARGGQLDLRVAATGERIVPRLSTAHNFGGDMLPVYQFLCDLQTQGLQPHLGIDWKAIAPEAAFTPRLTCGPVVLAPATWRLAPADWEPLAAAPLAGRAAALADWRRAWQLPRLFTLADGDNELFVDAENELLVEVWLDAIRTRPSIVLKEFLFDAAASPVRDAAGRPYVAQGLALLLRQATCYVPAPPAPSESASVQRTFTLGSEWLYYKLYCGQLVADRVLLDVLRPLAADLCSRGLIDTWFFIRYADPDNHLRVRWHVAAPSRLGEVVGLVSEYLAAVSGPSGVWKIQADTYNRELERYGRRSIGATEMLFGYQSQALLAHMAQADAEGTLPGLWLWGLTALDELLTAFGYPLARKLALLARLRAAFAQEFGMTKALRQQLDAKYRTQRAAMQLALGEAEAPPAPELAAAVQPLLALEAAGELEVPLDELLASYAHMLLNRLLPAEARLHELVLYDFLHRHYQACQARAAV
ncbi:MAG TPA: lantibiotic dehydratase [Hymenobacter sp.]|jgi:thiopeptide-type bacteriocin biosynthesis protein|uniref:lantibiotic dehydratase n=1 Tax=Hymenobacter sp. TaxID=1898978 RepID=UPI002EDB01E8